MVNWFIGSSDISARRLIDPCPSPITFPLELNKPCRQLEDWSNRTHTGGRRVVLARPLMADSCRTTKEGPCPLARAALTDRFLNTFLSRFVHSMSATSGKHRSVRRTIWLRRCSTPNRGCRRAARRLRRDRWTGGLSRELFQAILCARGGCGRAAWAYADRLPPRCSISLVFFPQLSPVYSRGYDLYEREQFLERSTLPSKMNLFHRLYHVLAILTSDAWLPTTCIGLTGFLERIVSTSTSKTSWLSWLISEQLTNQFIRELSRFRHASLYVDRSRSISTSRNIIPCNVTEVIWIPWKPSRKAIDFVYENSRTTFDNLSRENVRLLS